MAKQQTVPASNLIFREAFYHDLCPIRHGVQRARKLLGKHTDIYGCNIAICHQETPPFLNSFSCREQQDLNVCLLYTGIFQ
jgi:hypothetical protein